MEEDIKVPADEIPDVHEIKMIYAKEGELACFLPLNHRLPFFGSIFFRVLSGTVEMQGYLFMPSETSHKVHSPMYSSPYCMECVAAGNYTENLNEFGESEAVRTLRYENKEKVGSIIVIKEDPERVNSKLFQVTRRLPKLKCPLPRFKSAVFLDFKPTNRTEMFTPILIDEAWLPFFEGILHGPWRDQMGNQRIMVTGSKDVGKSAFVILLVNWLLSQEASKFKRVFILDFDIGQSLFTLPGLLSLVEVKRPILGPPEDCIGGPKEDLDVVLSVFFGELSPRDRPEYFKTVMLRLRSAVMTIYTNSVFIFNTMGWTRGLGAEVIKWTREFFLPTCNAHIGPTDGQDAYLQDGEGASIFVHHLPSRVVVPPPQKISSAAKRDRIIERYFNGPFSRAHCVRVDLNCLGLRCDPTNAFVYNSKEELVISLFHSLVGLLDEDHACKGIAFVSDISVDSDRRVFVDLVTHFSVRELESERIVILERASHSFNPNFLVAFAMETPPYVESAPAAAIGGKEVRSRRNVKRRYG